MPLVCLSILRRPAVWSGFSKRISGASVQHLHGPADCFVPEYPIKNKGTGQPNIATKAALSVEMSFRGAKRPSNDASRGLRLAAFHGCSTGVFIQLVSPPEMPENVSGNIAADSVSILCCSVEMPSDARRLCLGVKTGGHSMSNASRSKHQPCLAGWHSRAPSLTFRMLVHDAAVRCSASSVMIEELNPSESDVKSKLRGKARS